MERVFGDDQMFAKRNSEGYIIFKLSKLTYLPLFSGTLDTTRSIVSYFSVRFKIIKSIIDGKIHFNGRTIIQDEYGERRDEHGRLYEIY